MESSLTLSPDNARKYYYGSRFYHHLGDVGCTGNEAALINCEHTEVGVVNYGQADAGVKCSCMFTFS